MNPVNQMGNLVAVTFLFVKRRWLVMLSTIAIFSILQVFAVIKKIHDENIPSELFVNATFINDSGTERVKLLINFPIGFYDEPSSTPGLAHLTEHLFFSQNKNFVHNLISKGGLFYGETKGYQMIFYFDIPKSLVAYVLNYLNKFIIKPNFQENDIKREIKVIKEEESSVTNPLLMLFDAMISSSNLNHPFSKHHPSYQHSASLIL